MLKRKSAPLVSSDDDNDSGDDEKVEQPVSLSLSDEQRYAYDCVMDGESISLTGSAGTGKSRVINAISAACKKERTKFAVAAPTGMAASHVGGTTIHGFMRVGLINQLPFADAVKKMKRMKGRNSQRLNALSLVIIDEISMCGIYLFTLLHTYCCIMRGTSFDVPFGGLQMVICGDFLQLPPVPEQYRPEDVKDPRFVFAFCSRIWYRLLKPRSIVLTEVHRQADPLFAALLARMRTGDMTEEDHDWFRSREGIKPPNRKANPPPAMYALNADADRVNDRKYRKLQGEERVYLSNAYYAPTAPLPKGKRRWWTPSQRADVSKALDQFSDASPLPRRLALKVRARVMLRRNVNQKKKLVNGSMGTVTGFDVESGMPLVVFDKIPGVVHTIQIARIESPERADLPSGGGKLVYEQVPLVLAWATSVHKSQGATLEAAVMKLDRTMFEYGQCFVAVSRVETKKGVFLDGRYDPKAVKVNPLVRAYCKEQERQAKRQRVH